MKTKIEIKSFLTSSILFESECDGNTILKTLKEAVNKGADLQGADLQGADLQGADLRGAYLQGADLQGADLRGADLRGADLRGADLQYANLQYANLRGAYFGCANLGGANLQGANLGGKKIKTANVITGLYKYSVIPYFTECGDIRIKMGCCDRLLSEWESNFWNNNIEFPNDNSINSNLRLMAFETAKKWIEIVNQDKSQQ